MKHPPTFESLLQALRNAPREPYDPSVDYEPPHNPEWAKAENELQHVLNPRIRAWMDAQLAGLADSVQRWKAAGETKLWKSAQGTLNRYVALKGVGKEGDR
jgi:hypothetical protein